jgi:hypothetical protein
MDLLGNYGEGHTLYKRWKAYHKVKNKIYYIAVSETKNGVSWMIKCVWRGWKIVNEKDENFLNDDKWGGGMMTWKITSLDWIFLTSLMGINSLTSLIAQDNMEDMLSFWTKSKPTLVLRSWNLDWESEIFVNQSKILEFECTKAARKCISQPQFFGNLL